MVRWIKKMWRRYIVDECTYPCQCFECNQTDCKDCDLLYGKEIR